MDLPFPIEGCFSRVYHIASLQKFHFENESGEQAVAKLPAFSECSLGISLRNPWAVRVQLGKQAFAAAWAQERVMTPEQVLAALAARTPPAEPPSALPAQ